MKAKDHEVLVHAVCLGVGYGIRRFIKLSSKLDQLNQLDQDTLSSAIEQAVIDEIANWFTMDGDES